MDFVIDNTVADPSLITGVGAGQSWIVPTTGGVGPWAGHDDEVATYAGGAGGWTWTTPAAGKAYQILQGPNAGKIFVRSTVPSPKINVVQNPDLKYDPADYDQWYLLTEGAAVCEWDPAAYIAFFAAASIGDAAITRLTIPTVAGVSYNVVWSVDAVASDGVNGITDLTIKNAETSAVIGTVGWTSNGEKKTTFVATGLSTMLEFKASSNGAGVAEFLLYSVHVTLTKELMGNGDFEADAFPPWVAEPPVWTLEAGGVMADGAIVLADGQHAHADASVGSGTLSQVITGLIVGYTYQLIFRTGGADFAKGLMSVSFGPTEFYTLYANGQHTLYFRPAAASQTIVFSVTNYAGTPFTIGVDDVHLYAALWYALPTMSPISVVKTTALIAGVSWTHAASPKASLSAAASSIKVNRETVTALIATVTTASSIAGNNGHTYTPSLTALATVSGSLNSGVVRPVGPFVCHVVLSGGVTPTPTGRYLVRTAVERIVNMWGGAGAPSCGDCGCSHWGEAEQEALEFLNAAMQKLHASGKFWGFVNNRTLTLQYAGGEFFYISPDGYIYVAPDGTYYLTPQSRPITAADYRLPNDVISVKSAVLSIEVEGVEESTEIAILRPVHSEAELVAFSRANPNQQWTGDVPDGIKKLRCPLVWFAYANTPGVDHTPELTFKMGPPLALLPGEDYNADGFKWFLTLETTVAPPRYTAEDSISGVAVAVPHRHIETLLLPLARYYGLTSRYYRKQLGIDQAVREQAAEVLTLIGAIDPKSKEAETVARDTGKEGRL